MYDDDSTCDPCCCFVFLVGVGTTVAGVYAGAAISDTSGAKIIGGILGFLAPAVLAGLGKISYEIIQCVSTSQEQADAYVGLAGYPEEGAGAPVTFFSGPPHRIGIGEQSDSNSGDGVDAEEQESEEEQEEGASQYIEAPGL